MEPIIINPKEILQILKKKYGIQIDTPIMDFQYDPSTHLFGVRFLKSKSVISEAIDEEGQIIINYDENTNKIASIEILDINYFLISHSF